MTGPAWLGLGAQRSGTTWLVDLLTEHPGVTLVDETKELHQLHRRDVDLDEYRRQFPPGGGEFTPRYLRSLQTIERVRKVTDDDVPLIVILRDPVKRLASGMRHRLKVNPQRRQVWQAAMLDQQWAGMYADQLDVWSAALGPDRFVVLQYEQVMHDPQPFVDRIWQRLGLKPVSLRDATNPSTSSSKPTHTWEWPDGLYQHLCQLYRPQAERLADNYGFDPNLWPSAQ